MVYILFKALFVCMAITAINAEKDREPLHRRLTVRDESRAYMPVPPHGSLVLAGQRDEIPKFLNEWLLNALPDDKLKPCEEFHDVDELNHILSMILETRHPELQKIYKRNCDNEDGCDNRALRWESVQEYKDDWDAENFELQYLEGQEEGSLMQEVAKKGKCARAVMWFQHHLSEDARTELLYERDDFILPMMPESFEAFDKWLSHMKSVDNDQRKLYRKFTENPFIDDGPANCAECHVR